MAGSTYQVLERPNPRTYIGSGKVVEIATQVDALGIETVIFDDELSPAQLRSLEKELGDDVRVCDRTALILDIFSQRAATREGQLQARRAEWRGLDRRRFARSSCSWAPVPTWECQLQVGTWRYSVLLSLFVSLSALSAPRRWSWRRWSTSCRDSRACGRTWSDRGEGGCVPCRWGCPLATTHRPAFHGKQAHAE